MENKIMSSNENASCNKQPTAVSKKKPLVLSTQRFTKILGNSKHHENIQKEIECENKYKDYLKKTSDNMVSTFTGAFNQTQEQKLAGHNERVEKKRREEAQEFEIMRENDERNRRQRVAKAEEYVQQLKAGPRALQSAAMQCEVAKVGAKQRALHEEIDNTLRQRKPTQFDRQVMPWTDEDQHRLIERQRRNAQYKTDLLEMIDENSKRRSEHSRQIMREQQIARDTIDQEIQAQIERERAIQEKKRAALRRNALEAMKMVEQRRMRECIENDLQDKLNDVYNNGKRAIEMKKRSLQQQALEDHEHYNELNAQRLVSMSPNTIAIEEERIKRDVNAMQLKFTAQEHEKIKRDKQQKLARIQRHLNEMQAQKEAKERRDEEKRFEIANRFKNDEVNRVFNDVERRQRTRRNLDHQAMLAEQIAARKDALKLEKEFERKCGIDKTANEKADSFFVDYANKLIAHAAEKERPTYPFVKAIENYQKEFSVDISKQLPQSTLSHLERTVRPKPCCEDDPAKKPTLTPFDLREGTECGNISCPSPANNKRRYGVHELKQMNQFAPVN